MSKYYFFKFDFGALIATVISTVKICQSVEC